MFFNASAFNGDVSSWDVSSVNGMSYMFYSAKSFNSDLSSWNVSSVSHMYGMLSESGLSVTNYDNTLIGWAAQSLQSGVLFGAEGLTYCNGDDARNILINTYGWSISGDIDGSCCDYLTNTWIGPGNGNRYDSIYNWCLGKYHGDSDHIVIPSGRNVTIITDGNAAAYTLQVELGGMFETQIVVVLDVVAGN